jgi:hypothetical protein
MKKADIMKKDSKQKPQEKYDEKHRKNYTFAFMKHTEADLIAALEAQPNKAGYIKSLIRENMAKSVK